MLSKTVSNILQSINWRFSNELSNFGHLVDMRKGDTEIVAMPTILAQQGPDLKVRVKSTRRVLSSMSRNVLQSIFLRILLKFRILANLCTWGRVKLNKPQCPRLEFYRCTYSEVKVKHKTPSSSLIFGLSRNVLQLIYSRITSELSKFSHDVHIGRT